MKLDNERESEYAKKILDLAREELACSYPFLTPAIYALAPGEDRESIMRYGIGPDADTFLYDPAGLVNDFIEGIDIASIFLHSILHCIFLHPFFAPFRKDKELWDLSCDICVRDIMAALNRNVNLSEAQAMGESVLSMLKKELKVLNADGVYSVLSSKPVESDRFHVDDHTLWCPAEKDSSRALPAKRAESRNKWEMISGEIELALRRSLKSASRRGDLTGYFIEHLSSIEKKQADYSVFLKKFGVYEEVPRLDPDSFDLSLYTYGLELYDDMPVIEPLEYSERNTIREFAVAIDTSLSCPVELIRLFLEKTYDILFSSMEYGERKKMVIFQCDCEIQNETVIQNRDELKKYMSLVSVHGRGGTDFRPVFKRIDELNKEDFFTSLRGLLYFTDGDGIFPEKPPKYKTAFVMPYGRSFNKVPPWAMKVRVES